jgi:hypothetical protein
VPDTRIARSNERAPSGLSTDSSLGQRFERPQIAVNEGKLPVVCPSLDLAFTLERATTFVVNLILSLTSAAWPT